MQASFTHLIFCKFEEENRMYTTIEGEFVKIAYANQAHLNLRKKDPERPAARFNRPAQDALYLSPDEEAARVAIGEYVKSEDATRVLVRYHVSSCKLLDLRLEENAALYARAAHPWQSALKKDQEPISWGVADDIRNSGVIGLIDPSRRRPGLWHITLFDWNAVGAPTVEQIGLPVPIKMSLDYR